MDKTLEKIRALLAKAERTDNENERVAYEEKANELMLKYGVEMAQVAAASDTTHTPNDKIVVREVPFTGIYAKTLCSLAYNVAHRVPGVSGFIQPAWRGSNATFMLVGYESVLDHAQALIASLVMQSLTARDRAWKQFTAASPLHAKHMTAMEKFVWKRSFLYGFTNGVVTRLEAQHKNATSEPGTALAVRDHDARVNDWMADQFNLRTIKSKLNTNMDAKYQGNAAGRVADVGAKRVKNNTTELEG